MPPRNRQGYNNNGLLPTTKADDVLPSNEDKKRDALRIASIVRVVGLLCVLLMALFLLLGGTSSPATTATSDNQQLLYTCPSSEQEGVFQKARNYADTWAETTYRDATADIQTQNMTRFLENLENVVFDGWGKSYKQVKEAYIPWKLKYFAPYLNSGSTIYESASGIGLNLLLTLEIVQTQKSLHNIQVYGNEYVSSSVQLSQQILDSKLPMLSSNQNHTSTRGDTAAAVVAATRGSICSGDSTNLVALNVPSNSMDVVFSGYITPLFDPLNLNQTQSYYKKHVCKYKNKNQEEKDKESTRAQIQAVQQEQEKWYNAWIQEMIRIAKPGAPVIIEQASSPLCEITNDHGGVSQDFWNQAITKYQWDIDPSSLVIEPEPLFGVDQKRFNIFMLKNKNKNKKKKTNVDRSQVDS